MGTLQQAGVDPSGFSAQQGQAAAAAITGEARHRASSGSSEPISAQTAQWIASAATSPATPSQAAALSSMGLDPSAMTKWEAAQQLRNHKSNGTTAS
jgi:hypothetical protein